MVEVQQRRECIDDLACLVGGSIVDDHDFEIVQAQRLSAQGAQCLPQQRRAIVCAYDGADERRSSCRTGFFHSALSWRYFARVPQNAFDVFLD